MPEQDLRPQAVREAKPLSDIANLNPARSPLDQIRQVDISQIPTTRTGDMSKSFAVPQQTAGRQTDKSNLSFKDALPGLGTKEGRSPSQAYDPNAPLGGTGSGLPGGRRHGDSGSGIGTGTDLTLASGKTTKTEKNTGTTAFDSTKWERLASTGPVAQWQPLCLNKTGFLEIGNFRLQCKDNQIIAAWKRRD
jgi:hypothetical protein